jgi:hypothetical protein
MYTKKIFPFEQTLANIFSVSKTSREQKILVKLLLNSNNFLNYIRKKFTYLQSFLIDQIFSKNCLQIWNYPSFSQQLYVEENELCMIIAFVSKK